MVVIGFVVLVGLYFFVTSPGDGTIDQGKAPQAEEGIVNNTNQGETSVPQQGKKMAFSEFLKQGGTYKCTVHQSVNGVDSVGTTYISGKNVRGEYANKVEGVSMTAYVLVRDGYSYTWTSMAPTMGFKVKNTEPTAQNTAQGKSGSYSFNAEQIGDYDCQAWTEDSTLFTLPEGVTFTELSQ